MKPLHFHERFPHFSIRAHSPRLALGLAAAGLLAFGEQVARTGEPIKFQSAPTRTAVLEMFTSEGCSACPGADAWLSRLKDSPRLWKEVVPVAFHVDYMDTDTWKDPYASKAFSKRHDDYAEAWRKDSLYTPGFAWNGAEWRGWYDKEELPSNLGNAPGTLTASSEDQKTWTIQFSPSQPDKTKYTVHAALLGFDLSSEITGGKNSGTVLKHDFVVLAFAEHALSRNGNEYEGKLVLKPNPRFAPKRAAIAIWVTPARKLQPAQALGGWLNAAK